MPRAAHQSFGVVSTALNDTTGTTLDPLSPAVSAPLPPGFTPPPRIYIGLNGLARETCCCYYLYYHNFDDY